MSDKTGNSKNPVVISSIVTFDETILIEQQSKNSADDYPSFTEKVVSFKRQPVRPNPTYGNDKPISKRRYGEPQH